MERFCNLKNGGECLWCLRGDEQVVLAPHENSYPRCVLVKPDLGNQRNRNVPLNHHTVDKDEQSVSPHDKPLRMRKAILSKPLRLDVEQFLRLQQLSV